MPETIKDVKAKYTDQIMAMDGVRSIGIGLDSNGNQAIIIGVEKTSSTLDSTIPKTLDGFPVVVKTVGDIKAD